MDFIPTVLGQDCLAFLLGKLAGANARLVKLSNGVFGLEKRLLQRRLRAPLLEPRAKVPSCYQTANALQIHVRPSSNPADS